MEILVNQHKAIGILDIGSGTSSIAKNFVKKNRIECCGCLVVTVVTGATFLQPVAAEVEVEILGVRLREKCGVIGDFPHDVLLGVDFSTKDAFLN